MEANHLICDDRTCKHLLDEALKYHFVPEHTVSSDSLDDMISLYSQSNFCSRRKIWNICLFGYVNRRLLKDDYDTGSIPGLGRSHGGGNGKPLQYSWLENSMDREACWGIVHRVAKSLTQLK